MAMLKRIGRIGLAVGKPVVRSVPGGGAAMTAMSLARRVAPGRPIAAMRPGLGRPGAKLSPAQARSMGRRSWKGKTNTRSGPVVIPARLPNKAQWKRVHKRLHDWRSISIQIINRTGGMDKRRRGGYRGGRRGQKGGRR